MKIKNFRIIFTTKTYQGFFLFPNFAWRYNRIGKAKFLWMNFMWMKFTPGIRIAHMAKRGNPLQEIMEEL